MKRLIVLFSVLAAMSVLSACNSTPARQLVIIYQVHRTIMQEWSETEADWIFAKNITTGENINITGSGWEDVNLLSVSRDGKKVLFRRDMTKELWVVNTDGTGLKKILDLSSFWEGKYSPVADWSPDGQRLVVTGPHLVCFYKADGSEKYCADFPEDMGFYMFPTGIKWSPEGKTIAIQSDSSYGPGTIFFLFLGGGGMQLSEFDALSPSWSPDGKKVAFWSYNTESGGGMSGLGASLGVMDGLRQDTILLYRHMLVRGEPSWSPDGKKIVLSTVVRNDPPVPGYQLVIFDLSDCSEKQITYLDKETESSADFPVAWSPDGKNIAFSSQVNPPNLRHFVHQLRIVNTKTQKVTILEEFGPEKTITAIWWGFK
jgi:Tol biopolymer transport system component